MQGVDAAFLIAEKPSAIRAMQRKHDQREAKALERLKVSGRAQVEPPFRVIERLFRYAKVHYRGIAKNAAPVLRLFALSNRWMARRRLLPAAG